MKSVRRTLLTAATVTATTAIIMATPQAAFAGSNIYVDVDANPCSTCVPDGEAYFYHSDKEWGAEKLRVVEFNKSDGYAVVGEVHVKQPDGSWERKMRAEPTGAQEAAEDFHNITDGRSVKLSVCLVRNGTNYYCSTKFGTA